MVGIIIHLIAYTVIFIIGWLIGGYVKKDQVIGFYYFNVWEQAKSRKLHITPKAGGKLGMEDGNEKGILITLE